MLGSGTADGSLARPLRWIASSFWASRHSPRGHGPRDVSLSSGPLQVRMLLTGYTNGLTLNRGFLFIFSPPNMASVNISQLFVQWVGVWVVAAVAIHLRRS